MKPQPRLRTYRRRPLVRLYDTPDNPWNDVVAVAIGVGLFVLLFVMAPAPGVPR
jgi:hypothetical protein